MRSIIEKYYRVINLNRNILLIPGPITTSNNVKKSVYQDIASREHKFIKVIDSVRKNLLDIAECSSKNYSCILFQGCGTYANESVIGSLPYNSKLLTLSNGIYGNRIHNIAETLNLNSKIINCDVKNKITINDIKQHLNKESHVALVHHETSNGIVNNIEEISDYIKFKKRVVMVDGISSLGGIPINIEKANIDYFIGSSNKCLHAFPGISFVIANKKTLESSKNVRRSLSLDLYSQYKSFEENGQFRFTPPPQIVNSLDKSVIELIEQGGVLERYKSYTRKNNILRKGLEELGLESCISYENQGPIMVLFKYPWDNFNFYELYERLLNKKIVIYSAEIKNQDVFRLGNIGDFNESELLYCLNCIKNELNEMKLNK